MAPQGFEIKNCVHKSKTFVTALAEHTSNNIPLKYYTLTCKLNTGTHRIGGIVPKGTYQAIIAKYCELCEIDESETVCQMQIKYELDSKCQLHVHGMFSQLAPWKRDEKDFRKWLKKTYPKYSFFSTSVDSNGGNKTAWGKYIDKSNTELNLQIYDNLRKYKLRIIDSNGLHPCITIKYTPKRYLLNYPAYQALLNSEMPQQYEGPSFLD